MRREIKWRENSKKNRSGMRSIALTARRRQRKKT
jgi:hypothetical protein